MKHRSIGNGLVIGLAAGISCSAGAANSALEELLTALYKNGTIDQATYELVKQTAQAETAQQQVAIRESSLAASQRHGNSARQALC